MSGLQATAELDLTGLPLPRRVQLRVATRLIDGFFGGLGSMSRHQPLANPKRHGVAVERNVPYAPGGSRAHLCDVYRPAASEGPLPVVLYAHGGGFRKLSKETHWLMGLIFARRGFLTYNINYRLAPEFPFPAPLEDCGTALEFVLRDAPARGGDLDRLVIAGESAGANLATALSIESCYRRPEAWAKSIWDLGVVPKAVVPACGYLQVTNAARFGERSRIPSWLADYSAFCGDSYIGIAGAQPREETMLADPLLIFEAGQAPDRPLPAYFASVGTKDPLMVDTQRFAAALEKLGANCEARYYPGGIHAFHAFIWQRRARQCWRDTFDFLDRVLAA